MKYLLFITLLLSASPAFSQHLQQGKLIDSITGEPIAYATVFIKANPRKGVYSRENGMFTLSCKTTDSIAIVAIGYNTAYILPAITDTPLIYRLSRHTHALPPVIVSNNKAPDIPLGFHVNKKDIVFPGTLGGKIMVYIPPDQKYTALITSLHFSIAKPRGTSSKNNRGKLRVLLYAADTSSVNLIGESLLASELIISPQNKSHMFSVDVKDHHITMPSPGVYLGLEWLGEENNNSTNNIAPFYFRSQVITPFKTLESFFESAYYDPYLRIENKKLPIKYVPNFGLQVKKID